MAYDIRLVKLVNGDTVLGKYSEEGPSLKEVAVLQTVPTQQGVQMMLLPFGYPFEQDIEGEIDTKHVIYEYKKFPDELSTKYMEACSNLTLSTGAGLGDLGMSGPADSDIARLLKK